MMQIEPLFLMNRSKWNVFFIGTFLMMHPGIFIRESSSRIYSPFVFAIGQLLGEIPYSIVCGIIYWVLMVRLILCVWSRKLLNTK